MAMSGAERVAAYRRRHPDRVKAHKKAWADKNQALYREGKNRRNRAYRKRYPGRNLARNAKFRTTTKGVACYLYWNASRRARVDGVEFSLTKEWIQEAVERGCCEITGLPFSFENGRKPWAASIDRKDPQKGYTRDNVRFVVWMYNACKAEFTDADVLKMARALLEKSQ